MVLICTLFYLVRSHCNVRYRWNSPITVDFRLSFSWNCWQILVINFLVEIINHVNAVENAIDGFVHIVNIMFHLCLTVFMIWWKRIGKCCRRWWRDIRVFTSPSASLQSYFFISRMIITAHTMSTTNLAC